MGPYKDIQIEFMDLRLGEKLFEGTLTTEGRTIVTKHDKILNNGLKKLVGYGPKANYGDFLFYSMFKWLSGGLDGTTLSSYVRKLLEK